MKTARLVSKGQAFLHQVQSNLLQRNQKAVAAILRRFQSESNVSSVEHSMCRLIFKLDIL